MPISAQLFKDAMANLAAAVNVITTDGPAGKSGLTATAVCSVSDTPPTLLACVNRDAAANAVIKANGALCINVCSTDHEELCRHFAGMTDVDMDARFRLDHWDTGELGTPLLRDAIVNLEGRVTESREIATHTVFFIELQNILVRDGQDALTYYSREFKPLPV